MFFFSFEDAGVLGEANRYHLSLLRAVVDLTKAWMEERIFHYRDLLAPPVVQ